MVKKTITIVSAILIAFIVGLGAGVGYKNLQENPSIIVNTNTMEGQHKDTFADGWAAARQKLIDTGYIMTAQTNHLSGYVKNIDKDKLVFSTELLNPLDDESLKTRTAAVDSNTEIILRRQKTEEEIKTEEDQNNEKVKVLRAELANTADEMKKMDIQMQIDGIEMGMVDYFKEEKVTLADLKEGFRVDVEAAQDISSALQFTAVKISAEDNNIMMGSGNPPMPPPADASTGNIPPLAPPPPAEDISALGNAVNAPPPLPAATENRDANAPKNIVNAPQPPPPPPPPATPAE